ncbi:MAG: flagellin protein [Thermoplasmatales archaeon]|nr:flagellin protein [Thermoplasmatales archaeon]
MLLSVSVFLRVGVLHHTQLAMLEYEVRTSSMWFKRLRTNNNADIGIGALIIFIAMVMVAGVTASVMIQTMNNLQDQAVKTSEETIRDISSGLKISFVSGFVQNATITQLAIFVGTTTASDDVDLTYSILSLSDSSNKVILNYTSSCYSNSISNGLFGTVSTSNLTSSQYGLLVIRDIDGSCNRTKPILNDEDLVVLLVNTSTCFSGLGTRTEVTGEIYPEHGIHGILGFTTPSTFEHSIVDLQP